MTPLLPDPHLDELLDAALSPAEPPAGLCDRIVAATRDRLTPPHVATLDAALAPEAPPVRLVERVQRAVEAVLFRQRHPVLAFFGSTPAYRIAAALLLSAMAGIWMSLGLIAYDAHRQLALEAELAEVAELAAAGPMEERISALSADLTDWGDTLATDAGPWVDDPAADLPDFGPDVTWMF